MTPQQNYPPADASAARKRMVQQQLVSRGIRDERVLEAMAGVPRERFVPPQLLDSAWDDNPLPIGHSQTISQPYTVARMCEALQLTDSETVLEIGAGSGYSACVLACLARQVHTVERIPELACDAQARVAQLGYTNVCIHTGDGSPGLPEEAPFGAIVIAAGAPSVPPSCVDQLAEGGRLVLPVGSRAHQQLCRYTKIGGRLQEEQLGAYVFVPLLGKEGWATPDS